MSDKSCFIMGLPSAGKTTYLAALAYSLQQTGVPTKLHWPSFREDSQYLANLAEDWLSGTTMTRTSISAQRTRLSLTLEDDNSTTYETTIPDLSGEIFQKYCKEREMDAAIAKTIEQSDGVMLFVNPKEIRDPILISELPIEVRESGQAGDAREQKNTQDDPTEVQLVELLQFVDYIRNSEPTNLTVVISAWDAVAGEGLMPEAYVKQRLPLLWQYLHSNQLLFLTKYYGVSAQGGEYGPEERDIEQLIAKYEMLPAERILVVDEQGKDSHDITLPLWNTLN